MERKIILGPPARQPDFYEKHLGEWVNLHLRSGNTTLTGVISRYDRITNLVVISPYNQINYDSEGRSQMVLSEEEMELESSLIGFRETTSEDQARLRRIAVSKQNDSKETSGKNSDSQTQ